MKFHPFTKEHLQDAVRLMVLQSEALERDFPFFSGLKTKGDMAAAFLTAQLNQNGFSGAAVYDDTEMKGFLLGHYAENPFFGRHMWVPFGGIGLARPWNMKLLQEMYAYAGEEWVSVGVLNHYVVCPAIGEWLETFFSLSFGKEQAYAIAPLGGGIQDNHGTPEGIKIRQVTPEDAQQLAEKGHWIAVHLNQPPVWAPLPEGHLETLQEGYAELATDQEYYTWIALHDREIIAYGVYGPEVEQTGSISETSATAHFSVGAVDPRYRGKGVGRALFTRMLRDACQRGYQAITTDWRTTNLQAEAYWPSFRFDPYAYRLVRRVNPRFVRVNSWKTK